MPQSVPNHALFLLVIPQAFRVCEPNLRTRGVSALATVSVYPVAGFAIPRSRELHMLHASLGSSELARARWMVLLACTAVAMAEVAYWEQTPHDWRYP
jgi:hypothetical protein